MCQKKIAVDDRQCVYKTLHALGTQVLSRSGMVNASRVCSQAEKGGCINLARRLGHNREKKKKRSCVTHCDENKYSFRVD